MPDPKFKFPKLLGQCADRLFLLREKRLQAQKAVDALQAEETALKEHLIATLPKSESSGVAGKHARVQVTVKEVAQVKDWPAFYQHVKQTGDFELLQRRLGNDAIKERWEAGKVVPGVESMKIPTVSVTKL